MKRRLVFIGAILVLFLALAGLQVGGDAFSGTGETAVPESSGMPVPGLEDIEEMSVEDDEQSEPSLGMPVPGFEGVPEMIVGSESSTGAASSGMPVPGLEGIEETIVTEE